MQDPSTYQQMIKPQFPEYHEHLKCSRCESTNTKFCYYNNYNLSQPRHFCKNCKRYWTKGGTLRNIPVGGGSRKNTKRTTSNPKRSSSSSTAQAAPKPEPAVVYGSSAFEEEDRPMLDISESGSGSFSSVPASSVQFGNLLDGLNPHESTVQLGEFGETPNSKNLEFHSTNNSENFLGAVGVVAMVGLILPFTHQVLPSSN